MLDPGYKLNLIYRTRERTTIDSSSSSRCSGSSEVVPIEARSCF